MSSTLVRLACIFVSISVAYCKPELVGRDAEWEVWKKFHGKVYENEYVETYRKAIWLANREVIRQHNKVAARNFSLGMNQLGDLTPTEYRHLMLGARYPGIDAKHKGSTFLRPSNVRLPDHVDWRTQGYVTPVKDQGRCGSCWAFSSTGSLEGQHFKKTGRLVSLSEQNLVDCCIGTYGNHGCQGGWMDNAFNYIRLNNGIDTEAGYPYLAKEQPYCYFQSKYVGATDSGYVNIMKYSEKDLQVAVATVGPISVAIDASHGSFQFYRSGVYYEAKCSTTTLDHAVLVVGYGTFEGQDYWLVKNSWGTTWGMNGYVMMARNRNNQCGIATAASYPLV